MRSQAKRLVLFDMEEMAERHHSVISSVMLGALCGSGVLPFRKQTFEDAIKKSGIAVEANLAAFEDACQLAQRGDSGFTGEAAAKFAAGNACAGAHAGLAAPARSGQAPARRRAADRAGRRAPDDRLPRSGLRRTFSGSGGAIAALEARLSAGGSSLRADSKRRRAVSRCG